MVAMMMLGGVPMTVISPPSSEPKASGISISRGSRCVFAATCSATGSMSASAPMLFMKPEMDATTAVIAPICSDGPSSSVDIRLTIQLRRPEFCSVRVMTRMAATVMTAGWPKPEKASSPGTMPASTTAVSARSATTS